MDSQVQYNNSQQYSQQEDRMTDDLNVEKSLKSDMNSQDIKQYQDHDFYQESDLLQFSRRSPNKSKQHTFDLLEYQACRSRRLFDESIQLQQNSLMGKQIHQRLFEESQLIREKENFRDNIKQRQIKDYSEDSKMIEKTYKVLIKKLEKNITSFIQEIVGDDKQMNFEQLGRLLTVLDVFRILFYDQSCQFKDQELFNDESQQQNKRRFQEMVLHERLWTLLSGSEQNEIVPIQLVWCVLRILLDHAKITLGQRVNVISDYLEKFNNHRGNHEEIGDFIKYWQELKVDQMCYRKIGFLKPNKFEEYMKVQSDSLTFKPKINEVNYLLESHSTAKFLEKHPIEGVNQEYYQSVNKEYEQQFYSRSINGDIDKQAWSKLSVQNSQNSMDRVKLLYKKKELRDQSIYEKQLEKKEKEVTSCTFQPDVSINRKVNEWSAISKYGQSGIFDRLYNLDPMIEREMQFTSKIEEDQKKELEECTFTPQINRGIYQNDILNKLEGRDFVKGYDKTVGRLRYGIQEKQKIEQELKHIPAGENLEKERKKAVNPPSMLSRGKQKKRNPFYVIEVAMRPGKNGKISLYPGDDPYKVTENFAKSFSITGENKSKLFLKVKFQIDQYNAKIQQKINGNGNNSISSSNGYRTQENYPQQQQQQQSYENQNISNSFQQQQQQQLQNNSENEYIQEEYYDQQQQQYDNEQELAHLQQLQLQQQQLELEQEQQQQQYQQQQENQGYPDQQQQHHHYDEEEEQEQEEEENNEDEQVQEQAVEEEEDEEEYQYNQNSLQN